jgi:predicted transcriptional regulator
LVDIITSIFQQHSIASVIQYNQSIVNSSNYKTVYGIIFDYVKDHIKTNLNNVYELKKDLIFTENCSFLGGSYSGNDSEMDIKDLIAHTFGKIKRDATIYEAL